VSNRGGGKGLGGGKSKVSVQKSTWRPDAQISGDSGSHPDKDGAWKACQD
jgi:hypothetical protein